MYAPSQWEAALQCNIISHWLDTSTERSLLKCHNTSLVNIGSGRALTQPMLTQIYVAIWCHQATITGQCFLQHIYIYIYIRYKYILIKVNIFSSYWSSTICMKSCQEDKITSKLKTLYHARPLFYVFSTLCLLQYTLNFVLSNHNITCYCYC